MRTLRYLLIGMCLVALNGCCHRPFFAHRRAACGCGPAYAAPVSSCSCFLGAPTPMMNAEPPVFTAPMPQVGR